MQLPADLRRAYDEIFEGVPLRPLAEAAPSLSARYRQTAPSGKFIQTETDRLAYLATRLPATYAAAHRVFAELSPLIAPHSLLDLGAGSGAATWAAAESFETLRQFTLLEQDRALIALGERLAAHATALRDAQWQVADLRTVKDLPAADLVVVSYALNELAPPDAQRLALLAWQAARQAFVIIEPGTMRGFALLRKLRDELLSQGAHLCAPCPHAQECPMPQNDWCHFAARVERTALLRRLKAGVLNYEDEKCSYLIFTKVPHPRATARVLRHPQWQAGFVRLELCTANGLQSAKFTKHDKDVWRLARKADWGDRWE
jgi:ribosomal protein RSM22 (predicted rRNA methylase)